MAARKKKHPAEEQMPADDQSAADGTQPPADVQSTANREQPPGEAQPDTDNKHLPATRDGESLPAVEPSAANEEIRASSRVPIVGIGASAGGLEALQEFFSKMPADCGIGFVVVTHVRPGRESLMPELIANVTKIPAVGSEDNIRVEPNKIIVAKDSMLTIKDGVLLPIEQDGRPEDAYHPIDQFFRSLAEDQKDHAICVVLSGSGNDGTLGLKAIKAAGGMAMVQDSGTAKYPGMPESAAGTGLADYVLPPGKMPEALVDYCRGPYLKLASRAAEALLLPEDAIQATLVRLRAHTGHDFTCYKRNTMSRRIQRRMNVHHINEPQEYLRYLRENPRELDILLQELLISVTSFFRDPDAFEALAQAAIARLLSERSEGCELRVWVPGCATGEEAYSVAILLHEQIRKAERLCEVQMFATDLDEQAIDVARGGLYSEGIAADVTAERLHQYFTHEDGSYRINKNIRDMIIFATQNVVSDPPFTRIDLIVCRNLLIYLDGPAQQRVLQAFHYSLRPGGILFLGTSETPGDSSDMFHVIDGKNKIYRRREGPAHVHPAMLGSVKPRAHGEGGVPAGPVTASEQQTARSIERVLLAKFVPCSVVVDEHGTILYVHGRAGLYLEPEQGQPRNSILEMAREGLGSALGAMLRQARQDNQEIIRHNIRVKTNGDYTDVDVSVRSLTAPELLRGLLLVNLTPAAGPGHPPAHVTPPETAEEAGAAEELQRELQYTRENLQTTIEELQSANEELETSREEMQSLNEELNTVNSELTSKVNALARTNDDMNNLLNSMQIATIFLDRDLRVKRYTEMAKHIVRLIESDVGRPLSDLVSSLNYDALIEDSRRVLATLIPKEQEVQDTSGRWHLVRLMPYRTANNVIDGVVMTIVDIDRMKRAERKAQAGMEYFDSIVQTVRQPLVVLDERLRVVSANEAFYRTFDMQARWVEGKLIYELDGHKWDVPELRNLLEEILPSKAAMNDFQMEQELPKVGRRRLTLNARRLQRDEHEPGLILLAMEEVRE